MISYYAKNERVKEIFIFLWADKNWARIRKWIAAKHKNIKKVNSIYKKIIFLEIEYLNFSYT